MHYWMYIYFLNIPGRSVCVAKGGLVNGPVHDSEFAATANKYCVFPMREEAVQFSAVDIIA